MMAIKLNNAAFSHAKILIEEGHFVNDQRDAWSDDQPTSLEENEFIQNYGFHEYAKWHLGIDEEEPEDTKKRYSFPYGDFVDAHRCAVISAESRAGEYKHFEIERAAAYLLEKIDEKAPATRSKHAQP
jgi:hypothetical protein